ncbi:hypothetical protein OKA04_10040 [Luteolibacter flavescens]|uniref:Uncharacterized protein n=1 Tax=Luteolibacter flavescens TaxID=1859460 RepID=A0ABT3FNM4_9BACT|nr:hypothetical protein [Luteolibacter flavescens]MCW1885067.1 hypothetical protein [Luteolibacter flavescens]
MFLVFTALASLTSFLDFLLHLAIGWFWHLEKTAPALLPQWQGILLPLGCLVLGTWLVHRFTRWWISAKGSRLEWKAAHTLSATALLLLGAAAAIALSGVVHQAVWLSDTTWWTKNRMYARTSATMNIRQLQIAITDFKSSHGRYPDSLAEIESSRQFQYVSPGANKPPEPVLYLKPDEAYSHDADSDGNGQVILVSPLLEYERYVVGFTSGATHTVHGSGLAKVIEASRMPSNIER